MQLRGRSQGVWERGVEHRRDFFCLPNPVNLVNPVQILRWAEGSIDGHPFLDAEGLDAFAEGGAGHAEELGGLDLVAGGFGEGADNEFPFGGFDDLELRVLLGEFEKDFDGMGERAFGCFGRSRA